MELVYGYFLADFVSGLGHWFEDTYMTVENTAHYPAFIRDIAFFNSEHHKHPRNMTDYPWYETISSSVPLVLAFSLACWALFGLQLWWATASAILVWINQIHKWQHMTRGERPAIVTLLMRAGVLQGGAHHRKHHDGVFNTRFCILSPYLNPLLDYIKFWPTK